MKLYVKAAISIVLSVSLLAGCSIKASENNKIKEANNIEITDKNNVADSVYENNKNELVLDIGDEQNNDISEENYEKELNQKNNNEINLQEIKPNEAGQIMIVMYHSLGKEEKDYVRTIENFKEDLRLLYEKGYRLISLKDFIENNIDIEAGKTPVVLTFDDGNETDFNIIEENGIKKIDPDCVIGILEEFNKEHPDFGLEATFFINGGNNPFAQKELLQYKLNYIIEKGMDIGNHSYYHENLAKLSKEDIQKTLAKNVKFIKQYLPDYKMNTLALPFGTRPKDEDKRKYLYNGSFEGIEYENIGALAVGWRPEYPAIHKKFDPKYIHRVHGSSEKFGIRFWLEDFDKRPEKRYISDGDKDTITIPENMLNMIDEIKIDNKKLRVYKLEE